MTTGHETIAAAIRELAQAGHAIAEALDAAPAKAWEEGVKTALNYAIRNDDGITLRLEHRNGRPWVNPYTHEPRNPPPPYPTPTPEASE